MFSYVVTVAPALGQTASNEYRGSFRPGHNITVALGIQQSRWSLDLPSIDKPLTTERFNLLTTLSYGFHFQLYQRTGLVLGTALHGVFDRTSRDGFEPHFGLILPSILGGVVQNLGTEARIMLVGELGAAWYPDFKWRVSKTQAIFEGAVPDQIAVSAQLDWGLQKRNVFSLIGGWRLAGDQLVGEKVKVVGEGTTFPSMRHEGWYLSMGITRQVTETLTGVQYEN
ncbi:hypothetical protein EBU99_11595 [bacterium]|nr:hypothetical protein [bacterium]